MLVVISFITDKSRMQLPRTTENKAGAIFIAAIKSGEVKGIIAATTPSEVLSIGAWRVFSAGFVNFWADPSKCDARAKGHKLGSRETAGDQYGI